MTPDEFIQIIKDNNARIEALVADGTFLKKLKSRNSRQEFLLEKKNTDYSAGNQEDALSNFNSAKDFGISPLVSVGLRMSDKVQRFKSFCKNGKLEVEEESVDDVFDDIIGYCHIALALRRQQREIDD